MLDTGYWILDSQHRASRIQNRRKLAFTLIEFLVVVAIIAVLAALLLPVLQKAKQKGYQATCANNLRQIYLAFSLYADDYGSAYPWTLFWYDYLGNNGYLGGRDSVVVPDSLSPNGPRWPVLKCPAERRARVPSWPIGISLTEYENNRSSYHWNYSISYSYYLPGTCAGVCGPCRKGFGGPVDNPGGLAEATFVMDCQVNAYGWDYPMFGSSLNDSLFVANTWDTYTSKAFRHPGLTGNMLYLDGHVGTVKSALHGGKPYVELYNNPP